MLALEARAQSGGFTLLTLDAKRGEVAERLYRQMGWTHVGVIPGYALNADGSGPSDTVIFYKDLHRAADSVGASRANRGACPESPRVSTRPPGPTGMTDDAF